MKTFVVIGNGESRKDFDLNSIPENWATVGCNLIVKDYKVNTVISSDDNITRRIMQNYKNNFDNIMKRENFNNDDYIKQACCGTLALLKASYETPDRVFVLGFDQKGVGRQNKQINNMYKGCNGYPAPHFMQKTFAPWIYNLTLIFRLLPNSYFYFINDIDDKPIQWKKFNNVVFQKYEKFKYFINKEKTISIH